VDNFGKRSQLNLLTYIWYITWCQGVRLQLSFSLTSSSTCLSLSAIHGFSVTSHDICVLGGKKEKEKA
jgi:hypothetical protein